MQAPLGDTVNLHFVVTHTLDPVQQLIEWASARVPPTPFIGGGLCKCICVSNFPTCRLAEMR